MWIIIKKYSGLWAIILCAIASVELVRSQAPAVTMTTSPITQALGVRPTLVNTIHNFSSIPVTAWVVALKKRQKDQGFGSGYTIEDGFVSDDKRQIDAGGQRNVWASLNGDPNNVQFVLVAGLFADGSAFGDPEWAQVVLLRRQYAFRVDQSAISDLQAARNMTQPQMIRFLDDSEKRQLAEAKAVREKSVLYAASLPSLDQHRDMFTERTSELKAANVQAVADGQWENLISANYLGLKGTLSAPSPIPGENTEAQIQRLLGWYADRLQRLTESKPPLFNNATPGLGRDK